jgi:hypothetical protein
MTKIDVSSMGVCMHMLKEIYDDEWNSTWTSEERLRAHNLQEFL